jgi:hypothetical protein
MLCGTSREVKLIEQRYTSEDRSAQSAAFEGDDAVCEIAAGLEHGKARIDG